MGSRLLYDETSDLVRYLAARRIRVAAGHYRLRNGWIALRSAPSNRRRQVAYWNVYADDESRLAHRTLGGGEERLTRALANVLNSLPTKTILRLRE